jgi:hypothetical protein
MATRIFIGPPGTELDWDNWGKPITDVVNEHDGRIAALEVAQGAQGTPASTSSNSTTYPANTSGVAGVETRDAVLGNYVFTALANHRYHALFENARCGGNGANTLLTTNIRNGGASTPTNASTLIASTVSDLRVAGGPGIIGVPTCSGLFTPGAGVQTLGIFGQMQGTAAVGSANHFTTAPALRSLYVEDMGAV